ncbi:hypothetical protein CIPAW_03G224700 [Carya illinoinensis]|uniref:No apical meristem-associated C-terminal domain-containing protein n=1 Tax=Carya illinoinensis TaxID=32201 RepID=A0A8T1R5Y3_CARIL|nr:hypothetical protein CIPAW_03G224700 [Carya illinoinensis]
MDSQDPEHMYFTNLLSQDPQLDLTYDRQSGTSSMTLDDFSPLPPNEPIGFRKSVRDANFILEEDKLLISAWLNCSLDRTIKSLIHQWSVIQKATNKFCAKLAQIDGLNQSGMTNNSLSSTLFDKAKVMYQSLEKCSFQFEHCWHLLKDQPKWIWRTTKEDPKRRKTYEVIELDRPMGRKAEKGKQKGQGRQAEENFQLKKMKCTLLEESCAQKKEFYRLKVEKMEYDKEKEKKNYALKMKD